jgi:glycerol-3-phosphate dehydrogenase
LTIAGGKLTTYRLMAQEVVDRAAQQLGSSAKSTTDDRPLPGAVGISESDEALASLESALGASPRAKYFVQTYGSRATEVLARLTEDPSAGELLDQELPYLMAQVDEAVEHEFARTLDDVMSRRVPLVLRGRDQGLAVAHTIAARMAKPLGWSAQRCEAEVEKYQAVVASSRRFRA